MAPKSKQDMEEGRRRQGKQENTSKAVRIYERLVVMRRGKVTMNGGSMCGACSIPSQSTRN